MWETVSLTGTEQQRLVVLNRVLMGDLTAAEAAAALERSVRQVRRMLAAYRKEGAAALAHGNRGRTPAHALDPALGQRVIALAQTTYAGLNATHLSELLAEEAGISLSRHTVRRLRRAAGLERPRQRRLPAHRRRRERKPQAGMLLQLDASPHAWLAERGPWPHPRSWHGSRPRLGPSDLAWPPATPGSPEHAAHPVWPDPQSVPPPAPPPCRFRRYERG